MSDTNNTAQVVPFTYDDAAVRTIVIDGEPWFIARDICNALGLPNLSMALQRLAEDEKGVNRIDTLGGSQQMAIVMRELLLKKDWIYAQTDSRWSESKGCKVTRNRYSEKADKKRLFRRVETHEAPRFRGSEVMHTLKVTPAGAEAIARLIAKESAA